MKRPFSLLPFLLFLSLTFSFKLSQAQSSSIFEDFESQTLCPTGCGAACTINNSPWQNISTDNLDWLVDSAGTSSFGTGPDVDHTFGTSAGAYVYLESSCSGTGYPNQTGILESAYIDLTQIAIPELTFWYHMFGSAQGSLHVDVDTTRGQGAWVMDVVPAWTADTNLWQFKAIPMQFLAGMDSVRFRIRGVTGTSFTSDMALDDIEISSVPGCDIGAVGSPQATMKAGLTDTQLVQINIVNFGSDTINPGDTLRACYQINNQTPVCEDFILTTQLNPGDTLTLSFNQRGDFTQTNNVYLAGWTDAACDSRTWNNRWMTTFINLPPGFNCPLMQTSVAAGRLRPCRSTVYHVNYCNRGNQPGINSTVTIVLPDSLVYQVGTFQTTSGTSTLQSVSGDSLVVSLGNVKVDSCGSFKFEVKVPCSVNMRGRTLCVVAHIRPDSNCLPVSSNWDGSSLFVGVNCVNDSLACFTIFNVGSTMTAPTSWRLLVNNVQVSNGNIQLAANSDSTLCFPGLGQTVRLEVDQRPGHPGSSQPNATIELCGSPMDTTGLFTQLPQDDADPFRDIFCQEVLLSYDPNDKAASPTGTDAAHYIKETQQLEYLIRFQNTGNDTAFVVIIDDTLSSYLDHSSLVLGPASHPYTFSSPQPGILRWTFNNILLPDSGTNEAASNGFVKFTIKQKPGNIDGTVIENKAAIVFDINAPVITNLVYHTIGEPVVVANEKPGVYGPALDVRVYPNPFRQTTNFLVQGESLKGAITVEWYDIMGRKLNTATGQAGSVISMDRKGLDSGVYFYRITQQGSVLSAGKLIVE